MALSPKEREKIIEEERLRYETRQALHAEACAKHPRRGRWFWWLGALILAYAAYSHLACGRGWCSHWGAGCKAGHHRMACKHPGMMDAHPDVEPGQPIPKKP